MYICCFLFMLCTVCFCFSFFADPLLLWQNNFLVWDQVILFYSILFYSILFYCYRVVFSEVVKTTYAMGRKTWNLSRGGLTLSHSVLDHGLNLCQNIPLSPQVLSNLLQALWIFDVFPDFPWAALCAVSVLGPFDLQIKHFSQAYNANVICHVWCKCQPWMYPGFAET